MGEAKRKFDQILVEFRKKHKRAFLTILELMPKGYSDKLYLLYFKKYFSYLYKDIEKEYSYWNHKNKKLLSLGIKSRYDFPSPSKYVLNASFQMRRSRESKRQILNEEELKLKKEKLQEYNNKKLLDASNKERNKLKLVQENIDPNHLTKFINEYFKLKERTKQNFERKLFLIKEVSKYKNEKSIDFLNKINEIEPNFLLKLEAVYICKASMRRSD